MITELKRAESRLVYDYLLAKFDIDTIVPLVAQVEHAGSEFATYNAQKLYFGLLVEFGNGAASANIPSCSFYNEANVLFYIANNNNYYYDTSIPQYRTSPNTIVLNDIWFSRCTRSVFVYFRFVGYRITLV